MINNLNNILSKLTQEEKDFLNGRIYSLRKEMNRLKDVNDKLNNQLRRSKRRLEVKDNSIIITDLFFSADKSVSKRAPIDTLITLDSDSKEAKSFLEAFEIIQRALYANDFRKKTKIMELDSEGKSSGIQALSEDGKPLFTQSPEEQLIVRLNDLNINK